MIAILVFIIILSILVMLHEFGHFLMAKRAGIGVEEFGFGLPPRLWGKKIHGTIYSVNWLPFGGFVRLVGEDPTDKRRDDRNSFYVKTIGERSGVVVAGVLMNFILAVVVFYAVILLLGFKVSLPLLVPHQFKFVNQTKQVLVVETSAGSVAFEAGVKSGDSILSADGQQVASIDQLQQIIRASQDSPLALVLENPVNNQTRTVTVVPAYNEELEAPAIGVALGELAVLNYDTLPQKIFSGFSHSYNTVVYSGKIFGEILSYAIAERDIEPVKEGISGPVGIASIVSQVAKLGPIPVLQLAGLLSLNLAVINVLPIPALDGGRFLFLIIEAVTRRRVYPTVEKWVHQIGFVLLLALIVLVTYNDILKLLR